MARYFRIEENRTFETDIESRELLMSKSLEDGMIFVQVVNPSLLVAKVWSAGASARLRTHRGGPLGAHGDSESARFGMGRPALAGWQRALRDRWSDESRQGRARREGHGGPLARLRCPVRGLLHLDRDLSIVYALGFGVFDKVKFMERRKLL